MKIVTYDVEMLEHLTEPVLVVEADGALLYANAFARGLLASDDFESHPVTKVWELENLAADGELISESMHGLALESSPHKFRVALKAGFSAMAAIEWSALQVHVDRTIKAVMYTGQLISRQSMTGETTNPLSATIFSYSQSAIIVVDETGQIEQISRAARKMFALQPDAEVQLADLLPELDLTDPRLFAGEDLDSGSDRVMTHFQEGCATDGTRFPAEIVLGHVRLDGESHVAIFIHDVSERADNVRALLDETADEAESGVVSQLASTIAHEVKQPLSAALSFIKASTKSLNQSGYNGREIAIMEDAARQVTRAGEIIQNMQRMVREEAIVRTRQDMNALVEEAVLFALIDTADLGVNTFFYLSEDDICADVDRFQIQQMLHNLVRNALDAMEDSHPRRLNVTTQGGNNTVIIKVHDSGKGLGDLAPDALFKPFVTSKADGMGLGLSICRRIVLAHGGQIEARSHPKGGAEFTVTLPMTAPEIEAK